MSHSRVTGTRGADRPRKIGDGIHVGVLGRVHLKRGSRPPVAAFKHIASLACRDRVRAGEPLELELNFGEFVEISMSLSAKQRVYGWRPSPLSQSTISCAGTAQPVTNELGSEWKFYANEA